MALHTNSNYLFQKIITYQNENVFWKYNKKKELNLERNFSDIQGVPEKRPHVFNGYNSYSNDTTGCPKKDWDPCLMGYRGPQMWTKNKSRVSFSKIRKFPFK